ncbi:MAG: FAD-binding oxidoreductase, partial [Pseudomonadota bacterium]
MSLLTINDKAGHYPASWYAATAEPLAPFPELRGELRADIAVVGGGFTGLSAALHAAQKGYDVVLVDAQRVGFGASGRNGGQVGTGQRLDQPTLEARYGDETARALWGLGLAAVTLVKDLITRHGIEAYWRDGIAHAGHTKAEGDAIRRETEHLISAYDHPALELLDQGQMRAVIGSDALYGGAIDRMAGHIHPLRFAFGLAATARDAGVRIFEQSQAHHVAPGQVRAGRGRIQADSVIIAGNGYLAGLERTTEAHFMPINNYIIATEPLGARATDILRQDVAVADSRFVVNY